MFLHVGIRRPYWCPWKGLQHGVSIQSFINLGKSFFKISRIWNIATDLIFGKTFCIFIFFHFPDSRRSVLNGLHFYFSLRDSANRELYYLVFNDCTNQKCKSVLSCSCHLIYLSHFRNPEFKRRDLVLIKIVQKVTNLSVTKLSLARMCHIYWRFDYGTITCIFTLQYNWSASRKSEPLKREISLSKIVSWEAPCLRWLTEAGSNSSLSQFC